MIEVDVKAGCMYGDRKLKRGSDHARIVTNNVTLSHSLSNRLQILSIR